MKDSLVEETCDLLAKLIQNKCVNPPGEEMRSIKTIQDFLARRNIRCQVFQSTPNRGNLVAKIKGTQPDSPHLMFGPSHVDVVPVENPDEWAVDPFSGAIKDEFIWGRGALDMLFMVVTQIQAFIKLHQENFQPRGNLILLIVADEEAGGLYGTKWMIQNHWEAIGQPTHAVTEVGGFRIAPERVQFLIGEKGAAWKRISFKGTSGHGSTPYGSDNAIHKAAQAITRLTEYSNSKIPLTTEYLTYLVKSLDRGFFARLMVTNKRLLPFTLKRLKKSDLEIAKIFHSLSRMTISPNMVTGGIKTNVIPTKASINVDIRTLPGQDEEYVITHLKKALGDLADEAEIESISPEAGGITSYGNFSPPKSDFVQAMEKSVQQAIPGAKLVPLLAMGATDARFLREKGIDAYGFALFGPETPSTHWAALSHGTNERVSIKTIELSLQAYYNLAKGFLS